MNLVLWFGNKFGNQTPPRAGWCTGRGSWPRRTTCASYSRRRMRGRRSSSRPSASKRSINQSQIGQKSINHSAKDSVKNISSSWCKLPIRFFSCRKLWYASGGRRRSHGGSLWTGQSGTFWKGTLSTGQGSFGKGHSVQVRALLETGHFITSQGLLERYNQYRLGIFWRGPLCTVQVWRFLKRGTYSSQVRVSLERDIQYR